MSSVTIRDLRTRFPAVREVVRREGEVVVTEHGEPAFVLVAYDAPSAPRRKKPDYYGRLLARMPRPLTQAQRRALDEADRDER
jgi:prevent-host-death family protein